MASNGQNLNASFDLMKKRLGIFNVNSPNPGYSDPKLFGQTQQERMIADKAKSLDRALKYSYQAAMVKKVGTEDVFRALINPNKVLQIYDDKEISIHWMSNFHPGDVFEWMGTKTHWIIYTQELTELAYFRGDIRKCDYIISFMDPESGEIFTKYASVRGPFQDQITSTITKKNLNIDNPNFSLDIILPQDEETLSYFKRYNRFYIQRTQGNSPTTCWRVEGADFISSPGVILLKATEYYANNDTDEKGILAESQEIKERLEKEAEINAPSEIVGEGFIKPKFVYKYTCSTPGTWSIDDIVNLPLQIVSQTTTEIELKWTRQYSGQFELKCGNVQRTIVVETLY